MNSDATNVESLYSTSPESGPLRQGEILSGVSELTYDLDELTQNISSGSSVKVRVKQHPLTIVLSPDCDLEWDYNARRGDANPDTKLISHVLMCDLEDESALRPVRGSSPLNRIVKSDHRNIVRGNRDERYHYLPASRTNSGSSLQEFYIDFKRLFAVQTDYLIKGTDEGQIERLGVLKPPWIQHLSHRFTFFLGRVGLPDVE